MIENIKKIDMYNIPIPTFLIEFVKNNPEIKINNQTFKLIYDILFLPEGYKIACDHEELNFCKYLDKNKCFLYCCSQGYHTMLQIFNVKILHLEALKLAIKSKSLKTVKFFSLKTIKKLKSPLRYETSEEIVKYFVSLNINTDNVLYYSINNFNYYIILIKYIQITDNDIYDLILFKKYEILQYLFNIKFKFKSIHFLYSLDSGKYDVTCFFINNGLMFNRAIKKILKRKLVNVMECLINNNFPKIKSEDTKNLIIKTYNFLKNDFSKMYA